MLLRGGGGGRGEVLTDLLYHGKVDDVMREDFYCQAVYQIQIRIKEGKNNPRNGKRLRNFMF
jgi:hypothetical protein